MCGNYSNVWSTTPVATARGKIEPGSCSTAIRVTAAAARPVRVAVRLKSGAEPPAEDRVPLNPPSGTLVGDPVTWRSSSRAATRPVAAFEFARDERIRVNWPVLGTVDERGARLLDYMGKALPVALVLTEDPATHAIVLEMPLSGLGRGDYLIDLTAGARGVSERHLTGNVTFTAGPGDSAVMLAKNKGLATSACVAPESTNQLLATTTVTGFGSGFGSGFPISEDV
jgi:hypothetical protein